MLLIGTCVVVGLIIVFMAVEVTKDQIRMTDVIENNIEKVDVDK